MVSERMLSIREAAARLFLKQGYSRTQISHIAKAVGVSVGTIYHDFNGKQEIMHFVLKSTIDPSFLNQELERPVTDEVFQGLQDEIIAVFRRNGEAFARHLEDHAAGYSFEAMISDAFDLLEQYAVGCLFLEKNAFEFPVLAGHYREYRKKFLNAMTQYLELFVEQGTIRPLENPGLTTILIVEILSWWAMDRRYTSFETYEISAEDAKKVCMDNILSAYAG